MNSTVDAPAGDEPAPLVIPPHTPVPTVTLMSLRRSHLALTRLADEAALRMRDMLAEACGVAVGDTVEYVFDETEDLRRTIVVTSLSISIERVPRTRMAEEPGNILLIVRGKIAEEPDIEYSVHWHRATCFVIQKGAPA